jgi:hypothetical protein
VRVHVSYNPLGGRFVISGDSGVNFLKASVKAG